MFPYDHPQNSVDDLLKVFDTEYLEQLLILQNEYYIRITTNYIPFIYQDIKKKCLEPLSLQKNLKKATKPIVTN